MRQLNIIKAMEKAGWKQDPMRWVWTGNISGRRQSISMQDVIELRGRMVATLILLRRIRKEGS